MAANRVLAQAIHEISQPRARKHLLAITVGTGADEARGICLHPA